MAISGMTGFGRTEGASGAWSWAVEARSVNGRNLLACAGLVNARGISGRLVLGHWARIGAQYRREHGDTRQRSKGETEFPAIDSWHAVPQVRDIGA